MARLDGYFKTGIHKLLKDIEILSCQHWQFIRYNVNKMYVTVILYGENKYCWQLYKTVWKGATTV